MLVYWLSPPRVVILVLLIGSFLLGQYNTPGGAPPTPEKRCGYQPGQFDDVIAEKDAIEITVWARANSIHCWRAFLSVEAARLVSNYKIFVRPRAWAAGSDADADSILPAASKGEGPDIAYLGHEAINLAYDLGYIEPLDSCLDTYPEFDTIRGSSILWGPLTRDGKPLGVPMEVSASGFFFSKSILHELGWSEEQIDQLPAQIRDGQFTLDDMVKVARQAVEQGIVQPGLGYWPNFRRRSTLLLLYYSFGGDVPAKPSGPFHLSRSVLQSIYSFQRGLFLEGVSQTAFAGQEVGESFVGRTLYQDTVAHKRVLFWSREISEWVSEYAANYVEGGRDEVSETIGYALFPSGVRGQPASTRWLNTEAYVILSEQATGRRHQTASCALLAKMMMPEIYSRFIVSNGTLSVLKPLNDQTIASSESFENAVPYFWDFLWQWPQLPNQPSNSQYLAVLDKYLVEVELGRLSPEMAVEAAVRELDTQLGDSLIVEP
jgi:inositol-phosphate transport system substrate-binding protein